MLKVPKPLKAKHKRKMCYLCLWYINNNNNNVINSVMLPMPECMAYLRVATVYIAWPIFLTQKFLYQPRR